MTIEQWLSTATTTLNRAAIATARLDSLVLLCDELGRDKSWILAHPEHILQRSEINKLNTKITQRAIHTPLAYIREKAEFYGREFTVDAHVLIPRPESESIIELLKTLWDKANNTVIDIGTGSGALAITAALELPSAHVIATDIDDGALLVATKNAERLHATVSFVQGDLLEPFFDSSKTMVNPVLLANLPYVPNEHTVNLAATHEPSLALFGGADGLDLYRKLCEQLTVLSQTPSTIITESLCMQHDELVHIMSAVGYDLYSTDGLAQCFVSSNLTLNS